MEAAGDAEFKGNDRAVPQSSFHYSLGVRINESQDDDVFYRETNRVAHELDDTRATGGVRMLKKSHLLEDVYTYNDFLHDGRHPGCNPKRKVTPDMKKTVSDQ